MTTVAVSVSRTEVLGFRVRAQQLDRAAGTLADTAVLDLGVQDSGADGATWALANRGLAAGRLSGQDLAGVWTVRGSPHRYRRADLPSVASAVAPFSEADAGKRIYDAVKPLRAAGIGTVEALDAVAAAMRAIVVQPMRKGDVSGALAAVLAAPYLRFCRPCDATHLHEMPFRLAALRAGLELQAGTSPPVLQPMPGFGPAAAAEDRHDVVRAYLRLLGPAAPKHVAAYLDAPVKDVTARWPADAVEVVVDRERRWVLAADRERLDAGAARGVRLLGPFDLFLQARDRTLLVDDPARAKALWPVLGRPGAVLVDGEIAGTWRPRQSGGKLAVQLRLWVASTASVRAAVEEQAAALAGHREVRLSGVHLAD